MQFAGTIDFITYIRDDGSDMQEANERLTTRKCDLMRDCSVVFADKAINLTNRYGQSNEIIDGSNMEYTNFDLVFITARNKRST